MTEATIHPTNNQPDITLRNLFLEIGRSWKILALCIIAGLLLAMLYLGLSAKKYNVHFTAVPVESEQQGPLTGLVEQSVSNYLPQMSNTKSQYVYFQNLLTSAVIAERLAEDPVILQTLFPYEWDIENNQWVPNPKIFPTIKRNLKRLFGYPAYTPPGAYRLSQTLKSEVTIKEDTKLNMTTVSMKMSNPEFAKKLLKRMYVYTNEYLKEAKLREMQTGMEYAQQQSQQVQQLALQKQLFNVSQSLQYQIVLLNTDAPFAAYLVDDITVSDQPLFPSVNKVLFIGMLLGGLAGGGIIFLKILLGRKEFY